VEHDPRWDDETADDLLRKAFGIDELAAGLVRDLGDEANPDPSTLPDEVDDEVAWRRLQRLRGRDD
jgi:hypothetical protein